MSRSATVEGSFDPLFAEQTLRSERLRISILAGVFSALLLYLAGAEVLARTFPGEVLIPPTLLVLFYELGMRTFVDRKIRARERVSRLVWYANATIEASFASIVLLLILSRFEQPVLSVLSPAQLVYVPFIVLAALQLDGRLPLYAGTLAGIQYGAIALYALARQPSETLPESLSWHRTSTFRACPSSWPSAPRRPSWRAKYGVACSTPSVCWMSGTGSPGSSASIRVLRSWMSC